jgi:hypothetical protein
MIQRKQTLFLAVAAVLSWLTWAFPVATYIVGGESFVLWSWGLAAADGTPVEDASMKVPVHVLLSVLGAALLATVFLYRNRPRQMRIVRVTYLMALGAQAVLFITDNAVQAWLSQKGTFVHGYGASFFLPMAVVVLAFLAERGIRADEALVRSMDRLR